MKRDTCDKCATPFSEDSIAGGRCTTCGTMITEKPGIDNKTADMVKLLLKELIKSTLEAEKKEDRMKMLPFILEGIDLFELKRR